MLTSASDSSAHSALDYDWMAAELAVTLLLLLQLRRPVQ
jgi:hypothetical protein